MLAPGERSEPGDPNHKQTEPAKRATEMFVMDSVARFAGLLSLGQLSQGSLRSPWDFLYACYAGALNSSCRELGWNKDTARSTGPNAELYWAPMATNSLHYILSLTRSTIRVQNLECSNRKQTSLRRQHPLWKRFRSCDASVTLLLLITSISRCDAAASSVSSVQTAPANQPP